MAVVTGREGTTCLNDAARRTWDVLVLGAGPAGAGCAAALARQGASTLLVERRPFPRFKVCGGCLNKAAVEDLHQAGLQEVLTQSQAAPLDQFHLGCGGRQVSIPIPRGWSIARDRFDEALVQAAVARGAAFLPATTAHVDALEPHRELRSVSAQSGSQHASLSARMVVLATGLGTLRGQSHVEIGETVQPGARVGVGAFLAAPSQGFAPGAIWMGVGKAGYAGAVRLADGRLNVAAALDPYWLRQQASPAAATARILHEAGWPLAEPAEGGEWHGTVPLTRRALQLGASRLLVAGDAAGYVEPFTGEGMAWALAAGFAAADLAARGAARWQPEILEEWSAWYRESLSKQQRSCRQLTGWLRAPWAVRGAVTLLSWFPGLAAGLARRVCAPVPQ